MKNNDPELAGPCFLLMLVIIAIAIAIKVLTGGI